MPSFIRQLQQRERLRKQLLEQRRRQRAELKQRKESGLDDLPAMVAASIELHSPVPQEIKPADPASDSVDDLVKRLEAIKRRLFWLQAVFANTLSRDTALEADRYRQLFHDVGEQLKAKDRNAFDRLVAGYEALLLAEPVPIKGTIPINVQRRFELLGELQLRPSPKPIPKPGYVPDGLQSFL